MFRDILSQKVVLLRRGLIAKLLLRDAWPNSMAFPNFLDVLGAPVIELNIAPAYKFPPLTTPIFWEKCNSC